MKEQNYEKLRQLVKDCQGDVTDAVRGLSGKTIVELGELLGVPQQSIGQCLRGHLGRKYPHIRRALEVELNLPPGSLDSILHEESARK